MKVLTSEVKHKPSIAGDALKLTMSKVITLVISMVIAMLLSRFRTVAEYGTYSQIMLTINLVTTIVLLGLPNSVNYFLARTEDSEERNKFLSIFYTLTTLLSILVGLTLVLSVPLLEMYFKNNGLRAFLYFFAIYPWSKIIMQTIDNILIVYRKTTKLMIFRVLNSLALLMAIVVVQIFKLSFTDYMIIYIVIEAVFTFSVYLIVRNVSGKMRFNFDKAFVKMILKFSIPIGLASSVGTLNKELDKLVISWFYDTESLAIYTNAARELPVVIVATSITAVLLPQMVRMLKKEQKREAVELWGNATMLAYIVICFIAAGIFVYAPEAIELLYSAKYLPGVSVFRVYALVLLFRATYFGIVLNATGRTRLIFNSSIIALVANILLNIVFSYLFGFIGPAIATLFATAGSMIYLQCMTSKVLDMSFFKIFPWRKVIIVTGVNIFLGIIFLLLKQLIGIEAYIGEIGESLILGAVWMMIYALLYFRKIVGYIRALGK